MYVSYVMGVGSSSHSLAWEIPSHHHLHTIHIQELSNPLQSPVCLLMIPVLSISFSHCGLAASDVRIVSRSPRKCTVSGNDSHDLQGLDVVQCAALVEANHGIDNLIMNEYACYV